MELTVKERLVVLTILPREAELDTIKIVHELRNELSFSEDEHKQMNIEQNKNGSYSWDEDTVIIKDFNIGEVATRIIKDELDKLNKEGKVTERHLPLFDKFKSEDD